MLASTLAGSTVTPRNNRNKLGDGEQKAVLLIWGLSEEICPCLVWGTGHSGMELISSKSSETKFSMCLWVERWRCSHPGMRYLLWCWGPGIRWKHLQLKKLMFPWNGWGEFGCAVCINNFLQVAGVRVGCMEKWASSVGGCSLPPVCVASLSGSCCFPDVTEYLADTDFGQGCLNEMWNGGRALSNTMLWWCMLCKVTIQETEGQPRQKKKRIRL